MQFFEAGPAGFDRPAFFSDHILIANKMRMLAHPKFMTSPITKPGLCVQSMSNFEMRINSGVTQGHSHSELRKEVPRCKKTDRSNQDKHEANPG